MKISKKTLKAGSGKLFQGEKSGRSLLRECFLSPVV